VARRKRWFAIVAVVGLAVAALVAARWPTDRDRLQGTWVGTGSRLTFDGHVAVLTFDGDAQPRRTYFKLDPWARPKRVVVWDADGPLQTRSGLLGLRSGPPGPGGSDMVGRGIYELDGDRLQICLPLPGAPFPTDFEPGAGAVMEFRRE
jgi:uncharacterized protein (TIGR03067 family)